MSSLNQYLDASGDPNLCEHHVPLDLACGACRRSDARYLVDGAPVRRLAHPLAKISADEAKSTVDALPFAVEENNNAEGLSPHEQAQIDCDILKSGDETIRHLSPFRIAKACEYAVIEYTNVLATMYENARKYGKHAPEGMTALFFRSAGVVPVGATANVTVTPTCVFRGLFLVIDDECDRFDIVDFRVGVMSQWFNIESARASTFKTPLCFLKIDPIQISQQVTLIVENRASIELPFSATLFGIGLTNLPSQQSMFQPRRFTTADNAPPNFDVNVAVGELSAAPESFRAGLDEGEECTRCGFVDCACMKSLRPDDDPVRALLESEDDG